ncbi:hypothetical protein AURDEDRAFT_117036 [Auricularia subglabra TFB-10046 SS5]|nr:hypothetical protein AURDEDRAFT_117036 [Auricularia subglabra TFB-10046 SS5]
MFFALAFVPLVFLALAVRAQSLGERYIIVNTATGLVFENHNPVGIQVGNSIVGAPYDTSRVLFQSWTIGLGPGFTFVLRNDRLVGRQTVLARADGSNAGARFVTALSSGTTFVLDQPFGAPGIYAIRQAFGSPFAVAAPRAANGSLTLQFYNATDLRQHWVFVPVPPAGSAGELVAPAVASPVGETEEGTPKL